LSKADISETGTPFILYGELYTTYKEVATEIKRKTNCIVDKKYLSKIGDVVIPTSGETPEEIATATCVMTPNVILAGDLNIFRINDIDGRFFSYVINHKVNKDISRIAQGKSIVHIKGEEISKIQIKYPSDEEQQKILSFIKLLSLKIEKQEQLIDKLKKYKRGVIQHIFRSHAKTDEKSKWTYVRLGDIFKKVSRRNSNGEIKNVITNSAEYGLIPQRDFFDKDIAVDGNTTNYYVIEYGDFVYNPRKSRTAPYGPCNRYTLRDKGIISPLYTCLVLQSDINPSYLAWYFKSDAWYRYIYDNGSQGVRHDRVSMTDDLLMSIPVILPNKKRQQKIADMLDMIESKLHMVQQEYEFLLQIKDGCMQQLFI
jgi:type I restriction enzyme S subunit